MATQSRSKYIITGRIINRQNEPLEGLTVRAYDQDPKAPANPLGKDAITDAEGRYTISFTDKDFKVGGAESGGPDVFIRVYDGDALLGESPVKRNAKKRITINLQVDLPLPAETMILHISSGQLSLGMQGPDVARIQQAMQVLGRTVPAAERAKRVLGVGSVAVLKALQADLGLPATGVVDAATVKAINVKLAKSATDARVVRGSVRDANRNPFINGFVEVFGVGPSGEQAIGKSPLNATDGSYEISYQPPPRSDGRVDLRVEVRNDRGPVQTTPSGASVLTNAGPLEVVDFIVSAAAKPPLSEFDLIRSDLLPRLGARSFTDLSEDENRHDVSLLAAQSGHSREQVAAIVLAHKLAADTKTPAAMFYGLLRQGLAANAGALHATNPAVRLKALQDAVDQGIVPKSVDGKNLSEPVRFEALQGQPDILFGERVPRPVLTMARPINDNDPFPPPDHDGDGGTEPDPDPPTPGSGSQTGIPRVVPKNLMISKALVSGDSLTVRGYLRLDYGGSNTTVNSGIAFPFGEFRFYGCRKIVTTAHISQMANKNFALAPKGTRFDGMWFGFAETSPGLTLLDGTFPSWPQFVHPAALTEVNEARPLPTDASSTVVNRIDISVLEGTASTFRLLAPHQDLQFVCDRPCFFMDGQRAFMGSSTGKSGIRTNPRDWVVGDLATVGLATDSQLGTDDTGDVLPDSLGTFTLLVRGPNGKRVARKLTPFNLKPQPNVRSVLSTFWSTRAYTFRNFHHAYLCDFVKRLNGTGIDGLLSFETQSLQNAQSFDVYKPTSRVTKEYPVDENGNNLNKEKPLPLFLLKQPLAEAADWTSTECDFLSYWQRERYFRHWPLPNLR